MGFLTRLLAGLTAAAALGTGLTGTANAVDVTGAAGTTKSVVKLTADDTNNLPDHLVNGDFEYLPDGGWKTVDAPSYMTNAYTSVDPNNGQYIRNAQHADAGLAWVDWPGFDQSKFAWKTDQKGGHDQGGLKDRVEAVELQQDSTDGNTYAEMVASETGRTIYQNLATIPGTLYKIRLKHASLCKDNVDQMQVVINGTPIEMTRVAANGKAGDKVGEKSTTIGTRVTNENRWHHSDQWETYEGYYVIPDGQTTTRFGFKAVNYLDPTKGNLLDDVTFARAYKLSYDKNASDASGQVPSNERGRENTVQPAESKTDGNVKTVSDDAAGRTVLECKQSGEGATGPYADKFCWIDWSNLPLSRTGEPIPVRINVPGGHIDADATVTHTDNAALTTKDFTGNKWSWLIPAYRLTGNTALAFHHIQGNSADPLASVMFSNITPVANQTAASVNVLKDFQLAFGDAETMSGYVVNDRKTYERTDIESDKTLDKLGMIGDDNPNQSYSEANTGYGTTHVTLAGGPAGKHAPFTDDSNSKGAAVIGATQPTRFKVSFKQVNHPVNNAWSAIAIGVYMPYLTAYPLTYDKNSSNATGEVPSNQRGKENTTQPAASKTNGTVKTVADDTSNLSDHLVNGDFEYPGANVLSKHRYDEKDANWWGVSRKDKMVYDPSHEIQWVSLPSTFDSDRFAWDSTEVARVQNGSSQWHTNEVELQRDSRTGNMYGELCAYQANTSIRQYIRTTPGVLYKVRLKHASLSRDYLDKMQVLIGPGGNEQPVRMTRVESQNGLDSTGESTASTTISTHASNEMEIKDGQGTPYSSRNHNGQWATYEGVYVATSDVTSFTFKSVDSKTYNLGNLLDDIVFDKAYRLSYDKNATDANGSVPSDETAGATKQAKSKTNGSVRLAADDDVAEYAANGLPKQIMNGDFDHDWRNIVSQSKMTGKYNFANVDPAHGDVEISGGLNSKGEASKQWVHLNGFDAARFGWKSNQTDTRVDGRGGIVEIQRSRANDNMYAEITASQANTYLYQDIDTAHSVPTVYTVKLRYAHRNGTINSNEKIQILVGAPGHEQPVEMTRIASDRGNKVGEKSTTVNAPNTDGWLGSWDTFQGSVEIPAGQPVSRFTFKSLGSIDGVTGNLIDDVQFELAYKLSYDKNANDASGSVPSDETANTVKQAKTRTTGTVRAVADRTASGLTVHDLETDDVPGDYRQFVLNTTDTRLSQVEFENGAWYRSTDSSSQGMWPLKAGASLTIPSVGDWTDPSGKTHQISMTMRLKDWNGGSVSELYRFDGHGNIVGDGRFWINTAYGSGYSSLPAKVKAAMGGVDTSKRVGCSWTVEFTYADTGEKVPDAFKGVTGFNDLDGWDAQSDLKFEGVQLLSGFNGAYKRSDAELGTYGTNGFAGIGHDAGDEAHLNAPQQSRHRLAATWTGSTFTFSYDLGNPAGRTDGSRMTFGAPVTRTAVLTYDKNAADASGQVPSNTTPDTTQTASSKSTGKVSDLVQRTTTHEDGSVTVKTIDTSTDVVSGCQVYYPAGQRLTLATLAKDDDCWDSAMLTRPGHTQLGWNQDRNATQAQAQVTMVEGGMTVYAVWVGNPVLTYDTNKPSTWSGQMPSTPASISVAYNTAAADGSGWRAGDTTKIRGYRFLGWYTAPQDNAGLYDWNTLLTSNVTVYAHWQRLQANVIYDKNASDAKGSHANTTGWQYSDVTIPGDTSKSFTRDGYVFKGWSLKAGKADVVYKDGSQIPLQDKDITLYAQWQGIHENFTETGGISLPLLIAGGIGLLVMGVGSTVMLTRRMNGHGMPDSE
ncbi:InlB B-repeat-containing protein [Bifidobacterium adolescentis]|uniref:InlB B-repeat-containing protein n=1 Tax=Bifidobacterium adolescentis TaxID=1680 RepID=UPI0022E49EDF|nr:InlB B-repeat-containing protein [Bifidobacterium adolescentis]